MNQYKENFFDALMWAQAVENLTRDCILLCYSIKSEKLKGAVIFNPSDEKLRQIKKKMGLGGLVNELRTHIPDPALCGRISKFCESRNHLAHQAAADYMNGVLVAMEENKFKEKEQEYQAIKLEAGELFGKLLDIHSALEEELQHVTSGS